MVASRAERLLRESLVWDNHACLPLRPEDESYLPQLERYRDAGVDVVVVNIGFGEQSVEAHLRMLASFRSWLGRHDDRFRLAATVADIAAARDQGQLAVLFDIEGAKAIADQLSLIQLYYDLGVRWMLIAYNRANRAGGGCYDEFDEGLTPFGRDMIAEMERVGLVCCLTHTGRRTALDALAVARKPMILSHSNAAAVYPHRRNVDDGVIRGVAETGGVICLNGIGPFLGVNDNSTAAYVRHVDHVVQLVGPEHAGIGLDYVFDREELDQFRKTMAASFPEEHPDLSLVEPERMGAIVEAFCKLGYGDAAIRGILGGNLLRVAEAAWRPTP